MLRIGHITPSSNIVLEPLTYAMSRDLPVTHHFTRIAVRRIDRDAETEAQFADAHLLAAASLLAEAPLDVLTWNGTSASWRGQEHDSRVCAAVTRRCAIPMTSATLGLQAAFAAHGWRRVALAVPYTAALAGEIAVEYRRWGLDVVGAAVLGLVENTDFAAVPASRIAALLREAAAFRPDCIAVVCTNFAAAPLVEAMERELGCAIVDSVAVTLWHACRQGGLMPRLTGWGRLLAGAAPGQA